MAEKILNSYETIFIIDATLDEETVTALKDKFTTLIEQNGELESVDEWGKRRLAYEINDRTEGFYYLVNFRRAASNAGKVFSGAQVENPR